MAGARTNQRSAADIEFDRRAAQSGDVEIVNVSPFTWRHEIATNAGSPPRQIRLAPGETARIQRGYTVESPGAGSKPVPPALDSMSAREAWPGIRAPDKDGKLQWLTQPGPSLPMVVTQERAAAMRERWDRAQATKKNLDAAPLRLNLTRQDGTEVAVDAVVDEAPRPRAQQAAPIPGGVDDATIPIPEGDPDDMDDEIPSLPPAAPVPSKPEPPKRNGK